MYDPYADPTPYEVLGVTVDATAVEIRDRYNELQREVQEKQMATADRAKRKQELEAAYNRLRVAGERVRVDFTLLDPRIGLSQCEKVAATLAAPDTKVEGLVKPKNIRVTHDAVLGHVATFTKDPPRVIGLHPHPIQTADAQTLPAMLTIRFDC